MEFAKIQGSGNDFIIVDNRDERFYEFLEKAGVCLKEFVARVCRPHTGVGADGLILIENPEDPSNDFRWQFFNSDGSEAEMCGNGARCAVRFCYELGIVDEEVRFETLAGVIRAKVLEGGRRVKVQLTPPSVPVEKSLEVNGNPVKGVFINTGVPHFVTLVSDIDRVDVVGLGRSIRFHREFEPSGTNVDFVEIEGKRVKMRTYERGVEAETLSCGTGAVASAVVARTLGLVNTEEVEVITRSGEVLKVHIGKGQGEVYLEGEVRKVFEGVLSLEIFS
ncbi:MAG: diaminopimelate epimerase [Aquificota bacterium]|nr:diaminopimelate epimerase [Aquificota bacterium]